MGPRIRMGIGKKKAKSSKGRSKEGYFIAGALMPAAAFAAVPRMHFLPVPTLARHNNFRHLHSALLSSSALGHFFATPTPSISQPLNQDGTTEEDCSLNEYMNAKNVENSSKDNNSTFGSREFSNGLKGLAPPHGFGNEDDDSETDIHGTPYQSDHSFPVEVEINPVYSGQPHQASRRSRSNSPSTLRRSGQQLEGSGSLPPNSILRHSTGSPTFSKTYNGTSESGSQRVRAMRRSIEEYTEKSQTSLQSSLEKTLTRISTDLSASGSLRLNSLREQNAALVEKEKQLQKQLDELRRFQDTVISKLGEQGLLASQSMDRSSQEMGAVIHDTQKSVERTLDKQQELITALREQVNVVSEAKYELEQINDQLRTEISSICIMASARDDDDSAGQGGLVRKLKDECSTLRAATIRLNAELSRYQAKFRHLTQSELDSLPGLPFTGPKPSWLINTKYLAPLLVAYDDQLHDKDLVIHEAESALEQLRLQMDEVVKENQRLHIRLEQTDVSGPVGMTEWRTLQEQCKLVIEENQLLMEQVEVQHRKATDMTKVHTHEVTKLSKRVIVAEAERSQLDQEVSELREKLTAMKKEHNEMLIECGSKLGIDEHNSSLLDFKRKLEEERSKHAAELESLQTKLMNCAAEKKRLSIQAEELKSENQVLKAEMKVLQRSYKKAQKKVQILQQALQDSSVKEETAQRYLSSIIKVAEKVSKERDSFVEAVHTEQKQKQAAINKVIEGNVARNKAEEKLKFVKTKAADKLEKAILRMKEQDDDFNKRSQEYEREIKHLRLLLRERQDVIDSVLGDKRRVEDDLETMWQVTAADNQRMRETLEKSINKLEEHGNLRVAMAELEKDKDTFRCDSDAD